jgi:transglutaminase-like putative cysteine protease
VNDQWRRILLGAGIFAMAASAVLLGMTTFVKRTTNARQRTFAFTYQVHVPAVAESQADQRLWIPLPQTDEHQLVRRIAIETRVAHQLGKEQEYGNSYAVFRPTQQQAAMGYDVALHFEVTRHEYMRDLKAANGKAAQAKDAMLARYLQPDKLVPLNAKIAELAQAETGGETDPMRKARRIYDYVATTMHYDKSGDGWGHGDEMWACDSKRGNCTDFHSVLIGMMRSSGIPARFEIGFPLPAGKSQGDIPGYHCWAEFYIDGIGWVPVDASEASKNPSKRDYFFGAVDAERVRFTYGRDIRLSPQQKGQPLNFFIFPYAESNGQPLQGLTTHFAFRDLAPPRFH